MVELSLLAAPVPSNGAIAPLLQLHTAATPIGRVLSRFDRAQLESFIAVAIELLDVVDGDAYLEDTDTAEDDDPAEDDLEDRCEAADDGLEPIWRYGFLHYGARQDATDLLPFPSYGIDQTAPIGWSDAEQQARWKIKPDTQG